MNMFEQLSGKAALMRLQGLDSVAVKNAFFANYLAALMLVQLKDIHGLVLLNDPAHKKLQSFSGSMSDLCFWGRALFHADDKQVQDALKFGHADVLKKEAAMVLGARVEAIIDVVMSPPDQVDWTEVFAMLLLLKNCFGLKSSYFNRIVNALMTWDKLGSADKDKAVYDCFMYLVQSDPTSGIIERMREMTSKSLQVRLESLSRKVTSVVRIQEPRNGIYEDEGAGGAGISVGNIAGAPTGTGNSIIDQMSSTSPNLLEPYKFNKIAGKTEKSKGKQYEKIKKRDRKFKLIKFKAPSSTTRKQNA
jgi:hypothetical protein